MRASFLCCFFLLIGSTALAKSNYGYNPLHLSFRPYFPEDITSKGAAIQYMLNPIGYHFITRSPATEPIDALASELLPKESQPDEPVILETYLQRLAGSSYRIVVDHAHKLLTFERVLPPIKEISHAD
ncbi:MAG: hypothetical protein IPP74_07715 [Alphaproteobacteria bacterium]|nr:hypothetical protein [Alphaproteobacteria bacterium]